MRYRKPEELKETDSNWISEVPNDWISTKLKFYLNDLNTGGTPTSSNSEYWTESEDGIPWVSITDMSKAFEVKNTEKKITEVGKKAAGIDVLEKGTILYSIFASVGKVGLLDINATTNQAIVGLKPKDKLSDRFLIYWLINYESFVKALSSSNTQFNLNLDKVKNYYLALPPKKEQRSIAAFLDRKTEAIDALIQKKEQLIERLKEKRQALITQAVTKGLDTNVPMKDSGIEWLGEIPKEWSVGKLSFLTQRIGDGLHSTPNYVDESNYYFINGNNLKQGKISFQDAKCVSESEYKKHFIELDDQTILLSINGTIGNVAFFNDEKIILGKSACYIKCKPEIYKKYLYYVLQSDAIKSYFKFEVTGSTIWNLSLKSVRNTPIPLPSTKEDQREVVKFIERNTGLISKGIESIKGQLESLKEYRQSLISAAVTGKIDVRDEVEAESKEVMA